MAGLFRLIDSIKAFPLVYVLTDGGPGTVTEVSNDSAFRQAFHFSFLGVPGAFALSRARLGAGDRIGLWILATRMAPPIAFTLPYFLAYRHLGLLDTRTGPVIVCGAESL